MSKKTAAEENRETIGHLSSGVVAAKKQLEELVAELPKVQTEVVALNKEIESAKERLEAVNVKLAEVEAHKEKMDAALNSKLDISDSLQEKTADPIKGLKILIEQLTDLITPLEESDSILEPLKVARDAANQSLSKIESAISLKGRECVIARENLSASIDKFRDIASEQEEQQEKIKKLTSTRDHQQAEAEHLKARIEEMEGSIKTLQGELLEAEKQQKLYDAQLKEEEEAAKEKEDSSKEADAPLALLPVPEPSTTSAVLSSVTSSTSSTEAEPTPSLIGLSEGQAPTDLNADT